MASKPTYWKESHRVNYKVATPRSHPSGHTSMRENVQADDCLTPGQIVFIAITLTATGARANGKHRRAKDRADEGELDIRDERDEP